LLKRINAILPVQMRAKIIRFPRRANQFYESRVLSDRGALANVINAGRDAVDAGGTIDERC
jgi:hypothetical protein